MLRKLIKVIAADFIILQNPSKNSNYLHMVIYFHCLPWDVLMNFKDDKRSAGIQPPAIGGKIAITS